MDYQLYSPCLNMYASAISSESKSALPTGVHDQSILAWNSSLGYYLQGGGNLPVAIETNLPLTNLEPSSISIGAFAGSGGSGTGSISIGQEAGGALTGIISSNNVNIGYRAGVQQGDESVAIGYNAAGQPAQFQDDTDILSTRSVHIGSQAGYTGHKSNTIGIGYQAGYQGQQQGSIAIGTLAGSTEQLYHSIAIGTSAGSTEQLYHSIAIGTSAGSTQQLYHSIAIGSQAAEVNQNYNAIAIGDLAGNRDQQFYSIAIGTRAGYDNQGSHSVAIGESTAEFSQGNFAVAIGYNTSNQGRSSVAIGNYCNANALNSIAIGSSAIAPNPNQIVLNASNTTLSAGATPGYFAAPVRSKTTVDANDKVLMYNTTLREIVQIDNPSKTFVIDHPLDPKRYVVHACLEGPEAGVYYRGIAEIAPEQESVRIELPLYATAIARNFTLVVTPIASHRVTSVHSYEVIPTGFIVHGPSGRFSWVAYGERHLINCEPLKDETILRNVGPYTWLERA